MFGSLLINTLFLTLFPMFAHSFDNDAKDNVVVYWGQNSQGSQESLAYYCQNSSADIYLLSFLNVYPTLGLNFANACSDTFSNGLLHCSQIAEDIKTCQSLGKKVLLSLGGAAGSYGFSDDTEAETFAQTLWDTFGEGSANERPFDDAIVDGFDFDIENNSSTGYAALVNKLRTLFKSSSKSYYISAAPQCPYPDASVGDLLANVDVDFAFIQFYNNYCNVEATFNWDTWVTYAESVSPNSNIKLYLGLPASSTAASTGYISDMDVLASVISSISTSPNFGGISLWDASQGFANKIEGTNYIEEMKILLNANASNTTSTSVASSTSTTATSTTATSTTVASSSIVKATTSSSVASSTKVTEVSSSSQTSQFTLASSSSFVTIATSSSHGHSAQSSAAPTIIETIITQSESRITTTLYPASSSIAVLSSAEQNNVVPSTAPVIGSTTSTAATTTQQLSSTSTSAAATSTVAATTDVHVQAQALNAQYAAGQLNGSANPVEGDRACSADGKYAVFDHNDWVYFECAAGTSCYAYDWNNEVFTGCNFSQSKADYQ
ncbi:hypothetical protein TPHA_0K01080 [Tetrapisispora phaffii CBS 4417]|uniref:chitinase n=1 Tax=Tetrapisispora phaffii (strain ATCC 24235 / CBS 4417 / NBRC 1672 / NRRL Y-8282 / UCD 70-5) TaxID=1071381 RepID=G8BZB4_TETPH|nr:hypothetical protein TPHA_0K01080 [Tetrapisispora phaffii CBS 4417]CCE65242.1 hypothetical protein TPHA_0K01080 [Tetrapisispora phaffii CBS 4417]